MREKERGGRGVNEAVIVVLKFVAFYYDSFS